jgi:hypothetical protein
MSDGTDEADREQDRHLEKGDDLDEIEDFDEIEGWAELYAELVEVEQQVISTIRTLLPSSSERTRHEIEEHDLPVLVEDLERHRRRYGYWKSRQEEEGSAFALPDTS